MTRSFVSRAAALVALPALAAVSGCRGEVSEEPPVVLIRNMFNQPRYQAQGQGAFFADGRAMRPAVEGTVSRDSFVADEERATGRTRDGLDYVAEVPAGVADAFGGKEPMLARGRERFGIYCAPCHGLVGDGTGTVALRSKLSPNAGGARGFSGVASLHKESVRTSADGTLYATIANGVRSMPAYSAQIPTDDRWAIVAYVRALQLSQLSAK